MRVKVQCKEAFFCGGMSAAIFERAHSLGRLGYNTDGTTITSELRRHLESSLMHSHAGVGLYDCQLCFFMDADALRIIVNELVQCTLIIKYGALAQCPCGVGRCHVWPTRGLGRRSQTSPRPRVCPIYPTKDANLIAKCSLI